MAIMDGILYAFIATFAAFFLLYSVGNSRLFRLSNMFRRNELTWGIAVVMFMAARGASSDASAAALSIVFCVVLFGLMLQSIFPETPPENGEWDVHPRWWPALRTTAGCMAAMGLMIVLFLETRTILASS